MADYDFIGFTYNGKHSVRDLHIYRTSGGSMYDENMNATMTDKTADVPGGDGQYFFGTTFKNRTFTVNYAFDNLNEEDIRTIKQTFRGDGIYDLVFDETPYKAWPAKVTGTTSMKHLCFEETTGIRTYKGEGSITFTCYYPYAHAPKKLWAVSGTTWTYGNADGRLLNNYSDTAYPNKNEWKKASRLTKSKTTNVGDIPVPFTVKLTAKATTTLTAIKYKFTGEDEKTITLSVQVQSGDVVEWDTKTGLIIHKRDKTNTILAYSGTGTSKLPVDKGIIVTVPSRTDWTIETDFNYEYL